MNQRNEGIRPARLKGVKAARGDIIITLDMHTIFGNNFIEKIVSIFSNDPEVAIVSPLVVSFGDRFFQKGLNVIYKVSFKLRRIMKKKNICAKNANGGRFIGRSYCPRKLMFLKLKPNLKKVS